MLNNVETFCYVPIILIKGPEWFKEQGKNGCHGLKWVGIGGDVAGRSLRKRNLVLVDIADGDDARQDRRVVFEDIEKGVAR